MENNVKKSIDEATTASRAEIKQASEIKTIAFEKTFEGGNTLVQLSGTSKVDMKDGKEISVEDYEKLLIEKQRKVMAEKLAKKG